MKTISVRHLPPDATEEEVNNLFSEYGKVFSVKLVRDVFKGTCRGFGQVNMEGHEARAAMAGLDGKSLRGSNLRVEEDRGPRGGRGRRR
ncbi:MAG TPA: RNA-binding protein [Gammaproteobacteria bacterium]|nr:RNA-binding protein [Gammaproteobacteria bacterium]